MFETVQSYKRNIQSAKAEQLLARCNIFIDLALLRAANMAKKDKTFYSLLSLASDNNGYITTEYQGRDKVTFRMFVKKGFPNIINMSDPVILKSMKSRYPNGKIVELDYATQEYTIMLSMLKILNAPEDPHYTVCDLIRCTRSEAKVINNTLFYGTDHNYEEVLKTLRKKDAENKVGLKQYLATVVEIRKRINNFVLSHNKAYATKGFVVNPYGRKLYPKKESNIFNNIAQSVGSEVLIDSILKIEDVIKNEPVRLLFHKFDSLYFDFSQKALFECLKKIKCTMETINPNIGLQTKIKIGDSVGELREL